MVFDVIDDPRWRRLAETYLKREDLGSPELVGSARWNRAFDAWSEAFDAVVGDRELLRQARSLVSSTSAGTSLRFLHEVLRLPVLDYQLDVRKLLADPRVDLRPGDVDWQFALYVVEHTIWGREDPYESDALTPGLVRRLSRIGGAPTVIPGRLIPDDPFLLQVDLNEQLRGSLSLSPAKRFVRNSGLPRGGLLQLFHTTDGDSSTNPAVPGGGATVLYLTEKELRHRRTAHPSKDCIMFPVHDARLEVLPTFSWRSGVDDEKVLLKVIELQRAVDRLARGEEVSAEMSLSEAKNPFSVVDEPPSRLLGLQHYDYRPLEPADVELLASRLPLADAEDEHVLLFNVTSEFSYDGVFGDAGRLEIWMRRSDLRALRFDDVVSLIHSS
ncbi:MAG TPA: DUF1963 domain-containing protein [Arachnia sp.]|nr:DUF1963 domain-containing protein [Arachnia sp.]HMT87322.1 DUF1963 domain-containing protein [Arachnia sp.]